MSQSQKNNQSPERQPMVYHDFNLRFSGYNEEDGSYKVWIEGETPGGTMKPENAARCIYDPKVFWDEPETGIGGLIGGLEKRRLNKEEMFKLGKLLTDLAMPERMVRTLFEKSLAALNAGEGIRIRLHIDPVALVHLPWEYMLLPQASGDLQATDFLALRREISIVRTDTVESVKPPLPDRDTTLVVGVFSCPDGQKELDLDKDQEAIEKAVQALNQAAEQKTIKCKWANRPSTRETLEQVLSDGADIFHFAGHGNFDKYLSEGNLLLEKPDYKPDYYAGERFAQLLGNSGVHLVILGACDTGRRDGQNVWSGVAPALTRQKIPAVIANQFTIKNDNAILLASKVYPRLLAGFTVDEALYKARQAIYQHSELEKRDWGVPVLYLHDKDGVLFPLPEGEDTNEASKSPFLKIANTFRRVVGKVVDAEIDRVIEGRIEITNTIDVVEEDGSFTSIKIKSLGGD